MRRREFIAGLGGAAAWPLAAQAQQPVLPIIGWLHGQSPESVQDVMPAFDRGLADVGFVDGRNVRIEHHWSEGRRDRYDPLTIELVRRRVAVIVTDTTTFAQLAKAATQTIPIVFVAGGDPVEFGLVASFNRPGGNLTGLAALGTELTAKRLDLLHRLVPAAKTVAMLVASRSLAQAEVRDLQSAANVLGVRALALKLEPENLQRDVAAAFTTVVEQQAGAILVGSAGVVLRPARDQIISLAARHAIPTMFIGSESTAAGALSSYGPDFRAFQAAMYQIGQYAGRILMGEKPADLPVFQPSKFEFAINLQTAKRIGLEVPPDLLAVADKVIE
jgi:putative tryptophan/tyrosine transport system substrate-binding protein